MSFVSEKLPGTKIGKRSEADTEMGMNNVNEGSTAEDCAANGRLVPFVRLTATQSCGRGGRGDPTATIKRQRIDHIKSVDFGEPRV